MRFTCSRLSLLSVLRSWPGFLHFCDPMNESGLRAIVDVLYLNQLEVRVSKDTLLYLTVECLQDTYFVKGALQTGLQTLEYCATIIYKTLFSY